MALDRTGNMLGALALVIVDSTADAIDEASGHAASDAAALSALLHFLDRPTVDRLRQVLGLTPSGTVRLVDRLEKAGLVARSPGQDARSTAVSLTAAGRRTARKVAAARASVLEQSVAALSDDEREQLDRLLAKLLVSRMRGPGAVRWMCRLCDTVACGRDRGSCPIAQASGASPRPSGPALPECSSRYAARRSSGPG